MSWPVVKLGDYVSHISSGSTPKGGADNYSDVGPVMFLRSQNVHMNELRLDDVIYISEDIHNRMARSQVKFGDVLINITGASIGRVAPFELVDRKVNSNQHVCTIRPKKDKLNYKYLSYFLGSEKFQNGIFSSQRGGTREALNYSQIRDFQIPLPPIAEQKRIAAILDKADAIRRKRQQAIQLADDFLRALFLEMFGDPVTNPKGWEVRTLSEISTKILSGTTPKGGSEVYVESGTQFLRSQNVWKNHIIYDDLVYLDEKTHKSMSKSSLKHKDILMTKTGRINTENSSLGRAALFLGEDNSANINGHVYLIRLKKDIIHEFVVFILTTSEYRDYIRSVCVGGIDKRQINKEHLEDFPIILPPKALQEKFFAQLSKIRLLTESAKGSLCDAENMFNGLSQKAFSGQL
ncbi:MAG: restriction endonuclease subunit S [Gammaproteobacteria bacterium]|nr:restriction endonuclease subunit S [Gammaproteobacteria bacterium]